MLQETPPIQLSRLERILINSNKKLVSTSTANRVISIDWCKGFAIFWITYDHLTWVWMNYNMLWYPRFLFLWLEFLGPVTFLFFAGLNTTMSYRMARERKIPHAMIHYETFRRMMGLLVLVIMSRLLSYIATGDTSSPVVIFFQWDILQAIAFSAILIIPLLRFSVRTRIIISAVILVLSYPLYQIVFQYQSDSLIAQILNVIFYAPYLSNGPLPLTGGMGCPFFPMFAYTIVGSIVIDSLLPIINSKNSEKGLTPAMNAKNNPVNSGFGIKSCKILLLASVAIMGFSILFGFGPVTDPFFLPEANLVIGQLYQNPVFLSWLYLPQFLLVNHPMNILFKVGLEMFFFLLPFYYFDLKKSKDYAPSISTRTLSFFGQFSLSYYTYSFIFAAIGIEATILGSWIGGILGLIAMTLLFRFYLRKAYGSGLVEFVMVTFAIIWRIPPSIKDIQAVYPEKVEKYKQAEAGKA